MTVDFDLDGLGIPEAAQSAVGVINRVNDNMRTALSLGVTMFATEAAAIAPAKSGGLARSIRPGNTTGDFTTQTLEGEVIADAPHAAAIEFGSGLHGPKGAKYPIRPKFKKALRWPVAGAIGPGGDASSGYAFARKVMHPGVRPQRYLEQAAENKIDDVMEEMLAALEDALLG